MRIFKYDYVERDYKRAVADYERSLEVHNRRLLQQNRHKADIQLVPVKETSACIVDDAGTRPFGGHRFGHAECPLLTLSGHARSRITAAQNDC
jgi:hypothetical protein